LVTVIPVVFAIMINIIYLESKINSIIRFKINKGFRRGLEMNISSKGIGVRYNGNINLSTIKGECQNWGLSCQVDPTTERVYFLPKTEKPIEEAVDVVREMVRQMDGLEWDK
jgi:hypothetical protein